MNEFDESGYCHICLRMNTSAVHVNQNLKNF